MQISTEKQLLQAVSNREGVLVYGDGVPIRTIVRWLRKNQILVLGIAPVSDGGESMFGQKTKTLKALYKTSKDSCPLLVCGYGQNLKQLCAEAERTGFSEILQIDYTLYCSLSAAENMHLDFLCAGFSKCGTTSLQTALKKHTQIQLAQNKESYYLHWRKRYDDAPERFVKKYYGEPGQGLVLGDIEPSYHKKARDARECFGPDLKVILMMRNPIDAVYSNFKMLMKNPKEKKQVMYFRRHNRFHADMFDAYFQDYKNEGPVDRYHYEKYVQEYIDCFGRENVLLVIFEELIAEPERVMNQIQDFIGVKKKKYPALPKSNEGKKVSKNLLGAAINCRLYQKKLSLKASSEKEMERYRRRAKFWHKYTYVDNSEKMSQESRAELREFFADSVRALEHLCGRKLGEYWKDFG
ncbi:MAG: sulfotransferase domain-containing protein [Clostridiaceae bacterium]|nr:sulfotransferase domain-containing protein [Clostridiaceae bacterium]